VSDFFVAGNWRNRDAIEEVLVALDEIGASHYSFVRVGYSEAAAALARPGGADQAALNSTAVRELFEQRILRLCEQLTGSCSCCLRGKPRTSKRELRAA
jgi:hypothetical protein